MLDTDYIVEMFCEEWDSHLSRNDYVINNANVKGQPNLTAAMFCKWVNDDLLMSTTLEPGFPHKIGIETARKRMHELGFTVMQKKKGTFTDGH